MSEFPEKEEQNGGIEPKAGVADAADAGAAEEATDLGETNDTAESDKAKDAAAGTSTIFVKHVYDTKKPVKKGGLKRLLTCIIAVVLCGAIAGGVVLINKLLPNLGSDSSGLGSISDNNQGYSILKPEDYVKPATVEIDGQSVEVDTNISTVTFYNSTGQFSFKPYFTAAEAGDSSKENSYLYDTNWYIDGIDKTLTNSDAIDSQITSCLTVSAISEMRNTFDSVEEYHEYYGLNTPNSGFVVEFCDGTGDLMITVGSLLPTGDSYYFKLSGSDTVYVVSSDYADKYSCNEKEFADPTVIAPCEKNDDNSDYFNQTGDLARFDYIRLSGEVFDGKTYEFTMNTGVSADYMPYRMSAPYSRPASDTFLTQILAFADDGLEASVLYSYNITDRDIEECGFDSPKCIVEFGLKDYSFKLIFGGIRDDGTDSVAVRVEGKPQAFGVDQSVMNFLIRASNDETVMFHQSFIIEEIYTVKSLEFTIGSESNRFDLTHTQNAENEKVRDTAVRLGNLDMDTKSFKRIYQRVLMLSLVEFVTEAPKTEPVLTITFTFIEGNEKRVVEFTQSSDDIYHYVAWVDGVPLGEVLKSSVTDVVNCLETYLSGGEVPDTL